MGCDIFFIAFVADFLTVLYIPLFFYFVGGLILGSLLTTDEFKKKIEGNPISNPPLFAAPIKRTYNILEKGSLQKSIHEF